jgi:phosphonatase-like hydrolase
MIKMVVFDMAGTTVDEDNVVYKTLRRAINDEGFDFSLEQVLAEGAGKEKLQAIKSILAVFTGIEDDKLADAVYRRFRMLLKIAYDELDVKPQHNALALFRALRERDIFVILNTGYDADTAESLISKLGWRKGSEFDGLVTASDVENNRPDPDMILLAMHQFDIHDAAEVAKVGDSIIDIEEGRRAGCSLSIGITTGAHTFGQLQSAEPDFIVDDLLELLPLLERVGADTYR